MINPSILEFITFLTAMLGYAGLALLVLVTAHGRLPRIAWAGVVCLIAVHVLLVWGFRYEWQISQALRAIFWGGIICVLDIKTNGFDIVNDVLGMSLICWAIFALAKEDGGPTYERCFTFIKPVSVAILIKAVLEHFRLPSEFLWLFTILGFLGLAAIHVFCVAMENLCRNHDLPRSVQSWGMTKLLFIIIYEIPLGLNYVAALIAALSGESYHWQVSGDWVFFLVIIFFVPLIHLFVSTSRTKREIEARSHPLNEA